MNKFVWSFLSISFWGLYAADGTLDTTFGGASTGYMVLACTGSQPTASTSAIVFDGTVDSSDRVILVGQAFTNAPSTASFFAVRRLADGTIDTTFNPDVASPGAVMAAGGQPSMGTISNAYGAQVVVAKNNIIIHGAGIATAAAGDTTYVNYLWNLGPNAEDSSTAGAIGTVQPSDSQAAANPVLGKDNDERLLAAWTEGGTLLVERYTVTASSPAAPVLDITFSYATSVQFTPRRIVADEDNNVIIAGVYQSRPTVIKFLSTGARDYSFGINGMATSNVLTQSSDIPLSCAIQENGKIMVVGATCYPDNIINANYKVFALQFLPDGSLDTSFGSAYGFEAREIPSPAGAAAPSRFTGVTVLPNGQMIFAGASGLVDTLDTGDLCVARMFRNGTGTSGYAGAALGFASIAKPAGLTVGSNNIYAMNVAVQSNSNDNKPVIFCAQSRVGQLPVTTPSSGSTVLVPSSGVGTNIIAARLRQTAVGERSELSKILLSRLVSTNL